MYKWALTNDRISIRSPGFEMRCEDEDQIPEQDLFCNLPRALSKCTAGDDCYPHDWGEDSENENEGKGSLEGF